jgi:16S rRNA (guanine966-N2)-methyltransferase
MRPRRARRDAPRDLLPVRIIAGSRKGARIFAPRGRRTRPTPDRVREAAFNLAGDLEGARVLDLFAGSGAMGLEALSRGAERVTFVELDPAAVETIKRNLGRLGLAGADVVRQDAISCVESDARAGARYDLVLIDPPHHMLDDALRRLAPNLPFVVAGDGLVVVASAARDQPELPLPVRTSRRYGSVRLTVFEASA